MFDELELLRDKPELQRLLGHYAEAGGRDPEAWQDRLAHLEGVETQELVRLHGLLIAFGWVTQNSGNTPVSKPGVLAACYRITADGARALRRAQVALSGAVEADDTTAPESAYASPDQGNPRVPRRGSRHTKKAVAVRDG